MANTYAISVQTDASGNLLIKGDASTGVIQTVAWKLTGTDGNGHTAFQADTLNLPYIDPASSNFVPLSQVTVTVMLEWAGSLLNIPGIKCVIDSLIAVQATAPANPVVPLQLAPTVAAQAVAGVLV